MSSENIESDRDYTMVQRAAAVPVLGIVVVGLLAQLTSSGAETPDQYIKGLDRTSQSVSVSVGHISDSQSPMTLNVISPTCHLEQILLETPDKELTVNVRGKNQVIATNVNGEFQSTLGYGSDAEVAGHLC